LVIGSDFALGQNREGNATALRALGQEMNFNVTVIPPVVVNGEVVSSTAIRNALAEGDMKKVASLIGRSFSLQGRVITGASRGLKLNFPTANLDINSEQALPADGVYATWAYIDGEAYQSMANIGKRPTFGGNKRIIEVHILDYHRNLYERQLKIDIIDRIRGEKQFDTADELKKQITEDIKRGRAILNSRA
jgi:riboflavin kinase/FMN adenylyltransferase